jgi:hypothetical protein
MLIGRSNSFPIKNGPISIRQFAHATRIEANRTEVPRGDCFTGQCGPVGDPKDDEERSDALFAITVRQRPGNRGGTGRKMVRT